MPSLRHYADTYYTFSLYIVYYILRFTLAYIDYIYTSLIRFIYIRHAAILSLAEMPHIIGYCLEAGY